MESLESLAASEGATTLSSADAATLLTLLERKAELPPPRQSGFRVVAELTYDVETGLGVDAPATLPSSDYRQPRDSSPQWGKWARDSAAGGQAPERVFGANYEGGPHIGVCCCAERCALGVLRLRERRGQSIKLRCCYIATDSAVCITPGALCREFLHSIAGDNLRVVLAADTPQTVADLTALVATNASDADPSTPKAYHVLPEAGNGSAGDEGLQIMALGTLWPLASVYSLLDASQQLTLGASLEPSIAATLAESLPAELVAAHAIAVAATSRDDRDALHRMRYAAVAVDAVGAVIATSHQRKAVEYGCTPDPVCNLIALVETVEAGATPVAHILLVDQFGVCHAPWSAARALLSEHGGLDAVKCWAHVVSEGELPDDDGSVELQSIAVGDLLPSGGLIFCDHK